MSYAKAVGVQPRTLELWESAGVLRRALDAATPMRGDRSDPGEIDCPSARDQPDHAQADGQKQQMRWSPTGA
jgi:hypothetical protein